MLLPSHGAQRATEDPAEIMSASKGLMSLHFKMRGKVEEKSFGILSDVQMLYIR